MEPEREDGISCSIDHQSRQNDSDLISRQEHQAKIKALQTIHQREINQLTESLIRCISSLLKNAMTLKYMVNPLRSSDARVAGSVEMMAEKISLETLQSQGGLKEISHYCRRLLERCCNSLLSSALVGIPNTSKLSSRLLWIESLPIFLNSSNSSLDSLLKRWSSLSTGMMSILNAGSHEDQEITILSISRVVSDVVALCEAFPDCKRAIYDAITLCKGRYRKETMENHSNQINSLTDDNNMSGFQKRKICGFFLAGECKRSSSECSYAHGYFELTWQNKHQHSTKYTSNSTVSSRPAGNQVGTINQRFKTKICRHWSNGSCRRGDQCSFAHGQDEQLKKST